MLLACTHCLSILTAQVCCSLRFFTMLKPGGRLLITDYCRSAAEPSSGFAAYIAQRGYDLRPVEDYGRIITDAGFADVVAEDRTWQVDSASRAECSVTLM